MSLARGSTAIFPNLLHDLLTGNPNSERELLHLEHTQPDVLEGWRRQERAKLDAWEGRTKRNLGVWGKLLRDPHTGETRTMTLDDALALAREQHGHMTPAALAVHRFPHGHCVITGW